MLQPVSESLAERIRALLDDMERGDSPYDQGFPEEYEDYLFLYESYLSDRDIFQALATANASLGSGHFVFIAKEYCGPSDPPSDLLVPNHDWRQLCEQPNWGLEFYLGGMELEWMVWAYHEPCLHIGGSADFIAAFKVAYPEWETNQSPWYEPGGVPVCRCGAWWRPGWGNWRTVPWECPKCLR